jgi:hypothetical protein
LFVGFANLAPSLSRNGLSLLFTELPRASGLLGTLAK